MARNCSGDTVCIRIRLEWNEKSAVACRLSSAGSSVSTVTLELGTTSPMRWVAIGVLLPADDG
jgi:hypothetical protein